MTSVKLIAICVVLLISWNILPAWGQDLSVSTMIDYTPPADFVGGPNDYRAASSVTLTCGVEGAIGTETYLWSSTCTGPSSNCFVPGKTGQTITRTTVRSTDSGNHTCTVTRGGQTGSGIIEMNIVGAGIFVNDGDESVPIDVLPNNGIVIARDVTNDDRIEFQCRSGSIMAGVGQLVDLDGNTFNIGENTGVFRVESFGGQPGSVQFFNRDGTDPALTAADEGVYSCRIPDETGSDVDVNIGIYGIGFSTPPTVSSLTYDAGTRTLTCTSTDSPATTVTWTKDGATLTVDGTTYSMTQTLTDRNSSTYENVLTLPATGGISGTYSCLVGNALNDSNTMIVDLSATLIVEITTSGGDTVAGGQYTLTCTVTVPESSGLSGTPTVVWTGDEGKTGVTEGTAESSGRVTTLTLTFDPLQDSQDGDYTCSAILPVPGTNPATGMNVFSLDVIVPPDGPPLNFEITVHGPRTLTFSWDPPSEDLRNGVITGYLLSCDLQPEGLPVTYELSDFNEMGGVVTTLSGFAPSTTYNCTVLASNIAGDGPNARAIATTGEDSMLFQLQLIGVNCQEWVSDNANAKLSDVHGEVQREIESLCQCGFAIQHLSDSEFQCLTDLSEVTFRGKLNGTAQANTSELIEYIEQWIANGPTIRVESVRLTVDSTCHPVGIDTFDDPECGLASTQPSQSDSDTVAIIGGVVAVVIVILIIGAVVVIVALVVKNRRVQLTLRNKAAGKGEPVRWSEVAKSGDPNITATECIAYGVTPQITHQEPHEYEYPTITTAQTDARPEDIVYEVISDS